MDKKGRLWIAIFALAVVICAAAFAFFQHRETGKIAVISIDGEIWQKIDLSKVKEDYDIEIDTEYGHNTVHVVPGGISVSAADCPDQICVRQGLMIHGGVPIVCLPHRLVISIEGSGIDA